MMGPSDVAQRGYLEGRREALLALQQAAHRRAANARRQALDLVGRTFPAEVERLREVARAEQGRAERLSRAIRAIDGELREGW